MEMFFNLFEIAACILEAIFLFLFVDCFLPRSKQFHYVSIMAYAGITVLLTYPASGFSQTVAASFLWMLASFIFVCLSYQGNIIIKLAFVIIYNILDIAITTCSSAFISHWITSIVPAIYSEKTPERIYFLIVTSFIQYIILYYLKKYKLRSIIQISKTELLISFSFFICDFAIVLFTLFLYAKISPSDNQIVFLCFGICVFMIFATCGVLLLLHHLMEKNNLLISYQILKTQIEEQKKQLETQKQQEEASHYLLHDLKNILLNYQILLNQGDVESVKKDISSQIGAPLFSEMQIYSENALLNSLLHTKIKTARDYHIDCTIAATLPINYNNHEMMVILSNLIDNAIEAEKQIEEGQRKIYIDIYTEKNQVGMIIRNRISHSVLQSNPNLSTTKKDSSHHGLGLRSVQYYIEKNNGVIDFFEENDFFGVHIISPMPNNCNEKADNIIHDNS